MASDDLEGREAGTRGFDLAAAYVAERFLEIGLEPGGTDDTYFQTVPMLEIAYSENGKADLEALTATESLNLIKGEDYVVLPTTRSENVVLEAPVVFAGYCLRIDEYDYDDTNGLMLDGKIAACIEGAPAFLSSEEGAYFGSRSIKSKMLSDLGAVGVIWLYTTDRENGILPFQRLVQELASNFLAQPG